MLQRNIFLDDGEARLILYPHAAYHQAQSREAESIMSENPFPQVQQMTTFFEKTARDNAAALEAAVDTSVAVTKASLSYAVQLTEEWASWRPRPRAGSRRRPEAPVARCSASRRSVVRAA